eukprot:CAMPEP_0206558176 /NCGR_PEP_ID=MMETSP0325_2-20121206/19595_1 /ASSEMBLY_ACC=CAM_ASM_000347 /TAXON_ID=2866 /ORGANISM="Crypthecodinium cohnii, Strain Seligo" /LENGTH=436 /DNA_ID=CAMNT_0054059341 /DNA_START=46 /DNA_END=1356 /DNA_ORIENTATION=-
MIPQVVLIPFWYLFAVIAPLIQTLHALQVHSKDQGCWLFYWQCFFLLTWLGPWVYMLVQIPFFFLSFIVGDLFYEFEVLFLMWLTFPRTRGIRQVHQWVPALLKALAAQANAKFMSLLSEKSKEVFEQLKKQQASKPTSQKPKEPRADRPGKYTIIKEAGVLSTMSTTTKHGELIQKLRPGAVVEILEVVPNDEDRRVRGRLEVDNGRMGWISLLNMDKPVRWAIHVDDNPMPFGTMMPGGDQVFQNASAAGLNLGALFGMGQTDSDQSQPVVGREEAWEAMGMLEAQLARADDPSEDAASRQAASMLKTMLGALLEGDNPGMRATAQAMVPDLGKVLAHPETTQYLKDCLAATNGEQASASSSTAAAASSSSGAAASSSNNNSNNNNSNNNANNNNNNPNTASSSSSASAPASASGAAASGSGGVSSGPKIFTSG